MNKKNILLFLIALSVLNFCDDFSDPGLDDSIVESMKGKIDIFHYVENDSVEVADTLDLLHVKQLDDSTFSIIYTDTTQGFEIETLEIEEALLTYLQTGDQGIQSVGVQTIPYLADLSLVSSQLERYSHLIFKTEFESSSEIDILLGDYYMISVIEILSGRAEYIDVNREWSIEEFSVNTDTSYLDFTSLDVNEKKENLIFKERASFKPDTDAIYYVVLHNNQKNIYDDKCKLVICNY